MCCDSWSHKELDMTERLNRLTELIVALLLVFLRSFILFSMGFDCSSVVKNPPAMQKMLVQYLSWEVTLEEVIATHSSIIAWKIPWTEKPGGLESRGLQRISYD